MRSMIRFSREFYIEQRYDYALPGMQRDPLQVPRVTRDREGIKVTHYNVGILRSTTVTA